MDVVLKGLLKSETNESLKVVVINKLVSNIAIKDISQKEKCDLLSTSLEYLGSCDVPVLRSSICSILDVLLHNNSVDIEYFKTSCGFNVDLITDICYHLPKASAELIMHFFFPSFCTSWAILQNEVMTPSLSFNLSAILADIFSWKLPLDTIKVHSLQLALEHFLINYRSMHYGVFIFSETDIYNAINFLSRFDEMFLQAASHQLLYTKTCDKIACALLLTTSSINNEKDIDNVVFRSAKPFIIDSLQNNYLPLASLLNQLEYTCMDTFEAYERTISLCICNIVDDVPSLSVLKNTIFRIISWSEWSGPDDHGCTDLWVIGILSEFGRRNSASFDASASFFHDILLPMLKKTLKTCTLVNFKSIALVNILSLFLIIAGLLSYGEEVSLHCQLLFSFFRTVLISNPPQHEYAVSVLSKTGFLFKMATCLASHHKPTNPSNTSEQSKLSKLLKMFDLISRKFSAPNAMEVGACLKLYSWDALISAGSEAGLKLRFAWQSWCEISSKKIGKINNQPLEITGGVSASKTLANLPGLHNKGNTCYANAALQLLYNCSDFREAVLAPIVEPFSKQCPIKSPQSKHSSIKADTVSTDFNLWPLNPSPDWQPLHKTLIDLFSTLSDTKIETAQDPSAVLTLSKPSHFIQGEPQDSAEYLNHLLDCLHEEELRAQRNQQVINNESANSPIVTSTDDSNIPAEMMEVEAFSPSSTTDTAEGYRSLIRRLFGGTLSRCTACVRCQHVSSAELEDFICLFLPLDGINSPSSSKNSTSESEVTNVADLASLVQTHFSQAEHVTGVEECEACGLECSRERRLSLRHLSPNVLICLNLFTFNRATCSTQKLMRRVRINEQLSVAATSSTEAETNGEGREGDVQQTYRLQGIILHHGLSLACGHYTCVARVGLKWVSFDDGSTHFTSLDQVNRQQLATPYLLLYSKV